MKDNHAQARAREAEKWIEEAAGGDSAIEDLFSRAFVLDAYQAGRDRADDDGREKWERECSVVIEAAQLLRSYQSHHLVKARNFIDDHRDQWDSSDKYSALAQDSLDKATRNGVIAERLERWILGFDQNPAESLREISLQVAKGLRLEVDHPAFDNAAANLEELVDDIDAATGTADDDLPGTAAQWRDRISSPNPDEEDVREAGMRFISRFALDRDSRTIADITARLPTRKESPNLKPITDGPLGDPKVVDALVNVTSQEPDAEVQAAPHRVGGVADLLAFRVTTGDPRFQPDKPVTINGFLYRPVDVPTERKE